MTANRLSAEERRLSILRAAVPLFARQGFNGTTTRQIAAAAEVSEALLYKHFPSKEALYGEIDEIAVRKQQISDRMARLEPSTENLVRMMYALIRTIYEGPPRDFIQGITHAHIRSLMANSFLEDGAFARHFLEQHVRTWETIFGRCIDAARAAGDMVADWIPATSRWWFSHHLAFATGLVNMPEEPVIPYGFPREELLDNLVRYALRGMGLTDAAIARTFDPESLERFRHELMADPGADAPTTPPTERERGSETR